MTLVAQRESVRITTGCGAMYFTRRAFKIASNFAVVEGIILKILPLQSWCSEGTCIQRDRTALRKPVGRAVDVHLEEVSIDGVDEFFSRRL